MTRMEEELVAAWTALSPRRAGRGIETKRMGIRLSGGELRVGLDAYGARHLLVPLADDAAPTDHRSGGVVLVGQELEVAGRTQTFADLVCVRPELNDVFGALAADICESLAEEADEPTRVVVRALERWRQLLGPSRATGEWTMSSAIGLQGELLVLERILKEAGTEGLGAWTAPQRLHHDFRRGGLAVEVKTTTAREGLRVEIHGLEQLDSSADVRLALIAVRLVEDPTGDTLPAVVERLINLVDDRSAFLERLARTGYTHGGTRAPEQGEWRHYVESDVLAWWVDDDFPAIRRKNLPTAAPASIERLRYVLNLAAAGEPMSDEELMSLLSSLGRDPSSGRETT